jgi:hypothetical protein
MKERSMRLLKLELAADRTGEPFGASVETVACGVRLDLFPTKGVVVSPKYARAIAEALIRGAERVERRDG